MPTVEQCELHESHVLSHGYTRATMTGPGAKDPHRLLVFKDPCLFSHLGCEENHGPSRGYLIVTLIGIETGIPLVLSTRDLVSAVLDIGAGT